VTIPEDGEPDEGLDLAAFVEQFEAVDGEASDAIKTELGPAAFLRQQQERALVHEAEDVSQGWRAVTISTGDIDSAAEWAALQTVVDRARSLSPLLRINSGSDLVTIHIPPPAAEAVMAEVEDLARVHARTYRCEVGLSSRSALGR
jgi:hypothetical protein